MVRRYCRWPGWGAWALTLLVVWVAWPDWRHNPNPAQGTDASPSTVRLPLQPGSCEIVQVMDGNTLLVAQQSHSQQVEPRRFRVRLLGVRLPTEPFDRQFAATKLRTIAPPGPAQIELDKRRVATDDAWLAYVIRGESLVNAELLRSGGALHEVYPGDSMSRGQALKQAQTEARAQRRGLWSAP